MVLGVQQRRPRGRGLGVEGAAGGAERVYSGSCRPQGVGSDQFPRFEGVREVAEEDPYRVGDFDVKSMSYFKVSNIFTTRMPVR